MQIVTVGSKYQVVIPKEVRKKVKILKPGTKVGIYADGEKISIDPEPENWVDRNYGMMKEAWKGIDTTKYLEDLRNRNALLPYSSWERK